MTSLGGSMAIAVTIPITAIETITRISPSVGHRLMP